MGTHCPDPLFPTPSEQSLQGNTACSWVPTDILSAELILNSTALCSSESSYHSTSPESNNPDCNNDSSSTNALPLHATDNALQFHLPNDHHHDTICYMCLRFFFIPCSPQPPCPTATCEEPSLFLPFSSLWESVLLLV